MSTLRYAAALGAAMLFAGSSADAQLRRTTTTSYPDAQSLPTGMCRIWIEGVPAANQPAPTDCATARRNQPRNSRIIYGTRQPTNVYGNRDPRSIPGSPQYDPRYDPRSSQYDPRLDPHNRGNNGSYGNNGNYGRNDDKYDRKREKEREKWERKQQKEREKAWKKAHKGNGHDEDDDRHRNGQYGSRGNGTYGTVQQGCIDANRDGYCDSTTSSTQTLPRTIPQTIPQGTTTRRVCVDANRDGRCDDGGPLIRPRP
jgi:hypothetical protein